MACSTCDGEGIEHDSCAGRGGRWAHRYRPAGFDPLTAPLRGNMEWERCSDCEGQGRIECPDCGSLPRAVDPIDPDPETAADDDDA